jgi:hypothetical protein
VGASIPVPPIPWRTQRARASSRVVSAAPALEKKRSVPLMVLLALALTVVLVVIAVVANALSR